MCTNRISTSILALYLASFPIITQTISPYFSIRSQGLNTPRHISGLIQQSFTDTYETTHGTIAASLEYSRSFHNSGIVNCLFGTTKCPAITISGSRVSNRGPQDWLADYFYLPTDFKSKVSFDPVIDTIITDVSFYLGLDEWRPGLYFTLYAPLVRTRWDLNMCETIDAPGTSTHTPGYFTPDMLARNTLLNSFSEYARGAIAGPITQTVGSTDFTLTFQQLNNAKISPSRLARTRIADLRTAMGYQFVQRDRCTMALQALLSAPTGTRPFGEFLFEPTVGNSHHWEFGAGFVGTCTAWISDDEETQVMLFGDISLAHLFKSRQKRTLDLTNRPFSRYMLIERLGTPITNNLQGDSLAPSAQFKNEFLPAANLTNVHVDSKIALQAELTACITFICNKFSADIGYNLWGHTCEQLKLQSENPFDNNNTWALKGDSHVFGFDRGVGGAGPLVGAVPLSATQSLATIYGGTNFTSDNTTAQAILNPGIDYPRNATGDALAALASNALSAELHNTTPTIKTSVDPVFLKSFDLDACMHGSNALTSKIFTHLAYTFDEHKRWIPSLGVGGEIEWAHTLRITCNSCHNSCKSCESCALSQWGVWLKGGLTF